MMKALLSVRFRALFAGMTAQMRRKKKPSVGMLVLFAFLYLYVAVVICGMMGFLFYSLAEPYHAAGLDWLYFALSGLMGLGFAVFGSVFATQNQLYDAKDNDLLLSMPIKPSRILISRILPLLALNLLFAGIVMLPAFVVYAVVVSFSPLWLLAQLLALLAVCVLAQAIACLLGWLLHLLLSKMNKSFASMLYMVVFLGLYFYIYSQAGQILSAMAQNGQALASTLQAWVWPLYAMGLGCLGGWLHLLSFLVTALGVFAAVYMVLSYTFLHTATMQRSLKKRKLDLGSGKAASPAGAVMHKEFRKFLGCPVYLTNMGLGIIMTAAVPVAGLIFRGKVLELLELVPFAVPFVPLFISAILAFTVSTICISTPSVSLEGKNIWILKSMPLTGRQILNAKLSLHLALSVPVTAISGLILGVTFGCGIWDTLLAALVPALLAVLCGVVGLAAGLQWARLDYISEVYPCKQSVSVLVTLFAMMGVPFVLGLLYAFALFPWMSPTAFLAASAALLLALCLLFYRLVVTWGVKKWNAL